MNLVERIEQTAEHYSDRIAVDDGFRQITYNQLTSQADVVANILMEQDDGEFAAVMLPRSCWFTVAVVGVIKAGRAYIPLNPANPADYNLDILREAGAKSLITTTEIWEGVAHYAGYDIKPIFMDRLDSYSISGTVQSECDGSKPAALYFTSGTTGVRKGVLHSSDSLMFQFDRPWHPHLDDPRNSGFAVVTGLEFLASIAGLFTPLIRGGTSFIVPEEVRHDIDRLSAFLSEKKIVYLLTIGSVAAMLAARWKGEQLFLIASGERMPSISSALPDGLHLSNVYGMSECGGCLQYLIQGGEQTIPIGHPAKDVRVYVLDSEMRPVPNGEVGELYISSPGLAIGYFNNPELSRRSFVDCPFETGGRMYRTGDLVRMLPDGEYLYCGRVDDVVKIRGYRLELGDVENAVMECEGVESASVVKSDDGRLVMFYSGIAEEDAVCSHLKGRLPDYMCPGRIIRVDKMPRGQRGKTDRVQLRNMASWSEKEICLAAAFEKILKMPVTDTDFDFFSNGGDSLSVMNLTFELDGYSLDAATVYRERTLKRIASAMERIPDGEETDGLNAKCIALNAFQRRILETQLCEPSSTMWNNPLLLSLGKDCDISALSDALYRAVCNHPILLARLCRDEKGSFMFERADGFPDKGLVVRLVSVGCSSKTDIIGSLARPFDLTQGWPLFRIYIVSATGTNYLFLDFHHLICDGFSICVFMENVFRAYRHQVLPVDYGWQYMPSLQEACKVDLSAVCGTDLEYFTCRYQTGITSGQIRNAERRWGHSINVLAVAADLMALSHLGADQPVCVNWMYDNRTNAKLRNAFAPLVHIYGVEIEVGRFTGKSLLDEISRQMEYSIQHPETEYYCMEGSDLRHQPLLINNLIDFDDFCSSAPFEIREYPYYYAQSEPAEYLDVELHLSEGCLDFNLVGAECRPSRGCYNDLAQEFERCLKKYILG